MKNQAYLRAFDHQYGEDKSMGETESKVVKESPITTLVAASTAPT
ncbi:MAG: hypothetical protein RQM95_06940 [Syntrophaceticus schinkii]|jgi:hypothetical protein